MIINSKYDVVDEQWQSHIKIRGFVSEKLYYIVKKFYVYILDVELYFN